MTTSRRSPRWVLTGESGSLTAWEFQVGAIQFVGPTGKPASQYRERGLTMTFLNSVKRFLTSEDGPTAVEYAVMLALIVIVCLTAIKAVGTNANARFEEVRDSLT